MNLLTKHGKAKALDLVEKVIMSHGRQAILYRAESGEQLYGSDDANFVEVARLPIEMVATPHAEIKNRIDATACVLPGEDVRPEDRLEVNGETYRVQTVAEQHLFGVVTHIVLKLVKLHGR